MKIETITYSWDEVDIAEVAHLFLAARRVSPFWQPNWNSDWFQQFIHQRIERFAPSFVILARAGGKLVGMTGIITADPTLYNLWRWHPVVLPGENEHEIAASLIAASIQQMRAAGVHSLEVVFDFTQDTMTPETEAYYQKYKNWYELAGAVKQDEFVFMTCQASGFKPPAESRLKDKFEINALNVQAKDDIYNCFYQAFLVGKDRSFLGRTEAQRRSMFDGHFDDPENLNTAASLVLAQNQQVIGFTIFTTRPYVGDEHLSLICMHPDHQGKGLGQHLLALSMSQIAQQGDKRMSLGVDLDNPAAYRVYQKLGFKAQNKFITHTWQDEVKNEN